MLKKMVALVTGGGGSLGLATAKTLLKDGYEVIIMENPTAKNNVISKNLNNEALILNGDVRCENDVKNVMNEIKSRFGRLNVLVSCAAVSKCRQVYNMNKRRNMDLEEFTENINVNLIGTFNVINQAVPLIVENDPDEDGLRGVIINTSGFYAYDGQVGHVGLAAAGGAIASMTLPLSRDLATAGIRVMTIAPGIMASNLTSRMPQRILNALSDVTPNPKRLGNPEEYAHLVKSIIDNKFLNGTTIRLDGGMRLIII